MGTARCQANDNIPQLEQFLQVTLLKMETSLRIKEIRRTADFNSLAYSVLYDKKPAAGALKSLFALRKKQNGREAEQRNSKNRAPFLQQEPSLSAC